MRDRYNILAMLSSGILHAAFVASLLYAFDFSRTVTPPVPLTLKGTVLAEGPLPPPAPEPEPQPEPEPEPEPVVEEDPVVEPPPDPEPDPAAAERARLEAEERMRQEELARERERIAREQEAERQRQREAEAERKRRAEAEQERRRQEAEQRRQAEIRRQQEENERRRREAEEAERQAQLAAELAAEQARIDAMNAGALERYSFALQQKIQRNWIRPASATAGTSCTVSVSQDPRGEVLRVVVERCNGDEAVRRSVEAAVYKASPLPLPEQPSLFERNLRFVFEPTQ